LVNGHVVAHNSQLLKSGSKIAPRGIYTSGKGSTAAGLTAAVLRDKDTGNLSLEAGVLVLADNGIAAIDEFDKMRSEDRIAIHEAMEQLSISIAKAGIIATLNARTSIIAAANPYHGRYDDYKTVAENIKKLPPTILSRFDLIFILKDRPDPTGDERMADFILSAEEEETPEPPIDYDTLKNYIYYAKKHCQPRITSEAVEEIKAFYLQTRSAGAEPDTPVPITARYLEGLIRLAEARAKMALHEEVTVEDAQAVIQLMNFSLSQVGIDQETGISDIDAIETGITTTHRRRLEQINQLIRQLIQEKGGEPVTLDEIKEAASRLRITPQQVEEEINTLRTRGILYEPRSGTYGIVED
jgi:replicative DNA helicase Mcm